MVLSKLFDPPAFLPSSRVWNGHPHVCLARSVRTFSSLSGSSSLLLAPKSIFSPLNCRFHQDRYPINVSLRLKQELKKCLLNKILLEHHSQVQFLQKVITAHRMKLQFLLVNPPPLIKYRCSVLIILFPTPKATGPAGQVALDKGETQGTVERLDHAGRKVSFF